MAIEYDPKKRDYKQSDAVTKAQEMLQNQLNNKPGQYTSQWQSQLNDVMDKILNREKFSYDLNGDALYNQYKDQYTNQGKMAMMDTMGQAAAMTGGYGNSYAQNVGQQAYQGYLQQLNNKIPELYNLALSKYQMEGDDLSRQYSMLGTQENQDYSRYRDTVSDYNTELSRLQNAYDNERSFDYGQFIDDRNYQYQQNINKQKLAQAQVDHLISIGGKVSDELLAAAGYDPSYLSSINAVRAAQAAAAAASSGGGGGSRPTKTDSTGIVGVLGLGRGPISAEYLAELVADGEVIATKQGNNIVVKNAPTTSKPPVINSNPFSKTHSLNNFIKKK